MNENWAKLQKRIDDYESVMVDLQTDLVGCPALGPVNGGQGELKKSEIVENWLKKLEPEELYRIDAPDERVESGIRPNVVAMFKGRKPGTVWVLSHMDIVPPGEARLWDTDPFTLHRDGDKIYGRGVEDNHHGLVSSYFGVKALKDEGVLPGRSVGLIIVADEETGSGFGLDYILTHHGDLFSPEDLIIVPDAGGPDGTPVEVAEKSICWLKFKIIGKQCHASSPNKGANTLRAAARMISALDRALPETFNATDDLFTIPTSTFEPTKKEANVPNVNTIPGEDVFYFDCRVLPLYDLGLSKPRRWRWRKPWPPRAVYGWKLKPPRKFRHPRPLRPTRPLSRPWPGPSTKSMAERPNRWGSAVEPWPRFSAKKGCRPWSGRPSRVRLTNPTNTRFFPF